MGKTGIEPRIIVFDIECTDLRSKWGTLLCVGWQVYGEKRIHCPSVMDYPNWQRDMTKSDKPLLRDFIEIYNSADMVVSWFGKGFDTKWLNGKALEYGLPFLAPVAHVDLCFTAKANFKAGGNSLKNISEVGDFVGKKTPVDSENWRRAGVGHAPSIRRVIAHCKADILMTTEAYTRMRPLVRQHPRIGKLGDCAACGSRALNARGRAVTKFKGEYQRYQCNSCGSWGQRPVK